MLDSSNSHQNKPKIKLSSQSPISSNPSPFTFWFYFTISVSCLTIIFVTISSLSSHQDPKTWENHYSNGRTIKVQPTPHGESVEVFTIQNGPTDSSETVLFVHGLGCSSYVFSKVVKFLGENGVRAVAIDLPGSGFSDRFETVTEEKVIEGFGRLFEMYYNEIKENDYQENEIRVSKVKSLKAIQLGPEEMGRVSRQVIDTMGLAHVDLVLHDSAFNLGGNWVSKDLGFIRSVTLLDTTSNETSFPLWVLKFPVIRDIVSGFGFVFTKGFQTCCSNSGRVSDSERRK